MGKVPEATGQSYVGTIKSMNQERNFGFITCPELQYQHTNDVFFLPHLAGGKGVGDQVIFELALNDKGQPQAMNIHDASGLNQGMTMEEIMAGPNLQDYGLGKKDEEGPANPYPESAVAADSQAPPAKKAKTGDDPFAAFASMSEELSIS